jgi:hypothetical protein
VIFVALLIVSPSQGTWPVAVCIHCGATSGYTTEVTTEVTKEFLRKHRHNCLTCQMLSAREINYTVRVVLDRYKNFTNLIPGEVSILDGLLTKCIGCGEFFDGLRDDHPRCKECDELSDDSWPEDF